MPRECVLCTEVDNEEQPLLELPCFRHWVCRDCVQDFFVNATNNESLYPPSCCEEPVSLDRFAEYIAEDVEHAYRLKEQGEYTILPRYRVYCANTSCGKFLHPSEHVKDDSNNTYAVCDGYECFQATCCACKALLVDGIQGHICQLQEHDRRFRETVEEHGYKECFTCGATVELAEACNHITCECGAEFCYVCGKEWLGVHACPHYGPAIYDDEGYNQNGFHEETGLNRAGRTFREEMIRRHAHGPHNHEDVDNLNEEVEDREDHNPAVEQLWQQLHARLGADQWNVLQHLDPETREEALMQILDQWLLEGVILDEPHPNAQPQPQPDGHEVGVTGTNADGHIVANTSINGDTNNDEVNVDDDNEDDDDTIRNGNVEGDGGADTDADNDSDIQGILVPDIRDAEHDNYDHQMGENEGNFDGFGGEGAVSDHMEDTQEFQSREAVVDHESGILLYPNLESDSEGMYATSGKDAGNGQGLQPPSVIDASPGSAQEDLPWGT